MDQEKKERKIFLRTKKESEGIYFFTNNSSFFSFCTHCQTKKSFLAVTAQTKEISLSLSLCKLCRPKSDFLTSYGLHLSQTLKINHIYLYAKPRFESEFHKCKANTPPHHYKNQLVTQGSTCVLYPVTFIYSFFLLFNAPLHSFFVVTGLVSRSDI